MMLVRFRENWDEAALTRTEKDSNDQGDSREESRSELKSPCDSTSVVEYQICCISHHDTECSPHLPRHNQSTTNSSGRILSSEDRYS